MRTLRLLSLSTLLGAALAVSPGVIRAADANETKLLTQPAISATHIAFIYAGDLFVSDHNGGGQPLDVPVRWGSGRERVGDDQPLCTGRSAPTAEARLKAAARARSDSQPWHTFAGPYTMGRTLAPCN